MRRGFTPGTTASIYALSDPRTPHDFRYVGRTYHPPSARLASHVTRAMSRKPDGSWRYPVTHNLAWIRALARDGYRPHLTVLAEVPLKDRIAAERQWIFALLEAGHRLNNATTGGEGPENYNVSELTRARQSAGNIRRFANNPAERDFYRQIMIARYSGVEGRAKLSEQARRQWSMPGAREAHSRRLKEALASPEARQRRSEASRRPFDSERGPELRAEISRRMRGEGNPVARLTWVQVREIRARYDPRTTSHTRLAMEYGVSPTLIGLIIRRKIWIEEPETDAQLVKEQQ